VHRFIVYGRQADQRLTELRGAHLVGSDGVPIRGEIELVNGEIRCTTRTRDPFGLSLLWPVEHFGTVQLETTRLCVRDKPYLLNLELARHRLMRIILKREEWGLFDYPGMEEIAGQIDRARDLFIQALAVADDPDRAGPLADQALSLALAAGEAMTVFHATIFLGRRCQGGGFSREFLGAAVSPSCPVTALSPQVCELRDFVRLPFVWRQVQPKEQVVEFSPSDAWVKACGEARKGIRGGPVLSFGVTAVPDWMYLWENDFDAIVEYAREHVQRCLKRYARQVSCWVVGSGLHAENVFSFNLEQILQITRMAASLARDLAPRAQVVLDLTQPWGEYTAHCQRCIPPLLFADMAVQSGIPFDAFGLQLVFGIDVDGYHLRDLLQISTLLDKLANFGKPLQVTAVGVPASPGGGGQWRQPWSPQTQADWLTAFCEVALSKPFVESVCLQALTDDDNNVIPSGGLLASDGSPKPAFGRLLELRRRLRSWNAK
jgi:hypothetical protein